MGPSRKTPEMIRADARCDVHLIVRFIRSIHNSREREREREVCR